MKNLFLCSALLSILTAYSATWKDDANDVTWEYAIDDGNAIIEGVKNSFKSDPLCPRKRLIVPSSIEGHPVTAISKLRCCGFTTVIIPPTVSSIGRGAFWGASPDLETVVLPDSIQAIGAGAFFSLMGLERIVVSQEHKDRIVSLIRDAMVPVPGQPNEYDNDVERNNAWRREFIERLPYVVLSKGECCCPGIGPMTNHVASGVHSYSRLECQFLRSYRSLDRQLFREETGPSSGFVEDVRKAMSCHEVRKSNNSFLGYHIGDTNGTENAMSFMSFINPYEAYVPVSLDKSMGSIREVNVKYSPLSRVVCEISSPRVEITGSDITPIMVSFSEWRNALIAGGVPEGEVCKLDDLHLDKLMDGASYRSGVLYEGADCKCTWYAHGASCAGTNGYAFVISVCASGDLAKTFATEEMELKAIREKYGYCNCRDCRNRREEKREAENERKYQETRAKEGRDVIRTLDVFGYRLGQDVPESEINKEVDDPVWGRVYLEIRTCGTGRDTHRINSMSIATPKDYWAERGNEIGGDELQLEKESLARRFADIVHQQTGITLAQGPYGIPYTWENGTPVEKQYARVRIYHMRYKCEDGTMINRPSVFVEICDEWVDEELWREHEVKFRADMRAGKLNRKPNLVEKDLPQVPLLAGNVKDALTICGDLVLGSTNGSPAYCSSGNQGIGNIEGGYHCRDGSKRLRLQGEWKDFAESARLYYTSAEGKLFAIELSHWDKDKRMAEELTDVYNATIQKLEKELGIKFSVVRNSTFPDGSLKDLVARWNNGKLGISVGVTASTVNGRKDDDSCARVSIVFVDEQLIRQEREAKKKGAAPAEARAPNGDTGRNLDGIPRRDRRGRTVRRESRRQEDGRDAVNRANDTRGSESK